MKDDEFWDLLNSAPDYLRQNWRIEQEGQKFYLDSKYGICDFCSNHNAPWTLQARSFPMPSVAPGIHINSETDWAMCEPCKQFIEKNDWDGLLQRVKQSFPDRIDWETLAMLKALYQRLRQNIIGIVRERGK